MGNLSGRGAGYVKRDKEATDGKMEASGGPGVMNTIRILKVRGTFALTPPWGKGVNARDRLIPAQGTRP